jgi:hypothetical protein
MRPRILTELVGCMVSQKDYEMLKREAERRGITVSRYLRESAIRPLLDAKAAPAEAIGHDAA